MATPPDLRSVYAVSAAQCDAFRRDGFIHLPGLCSPDEVAAWRTEIRRASAAGNRELRPLAERDTYGKAFLQTLNLRLIAPVIERFVTAPRFGGVAAALLGVEAVRLFHEQSLFKEPGGGATPWHQDQQYWPLDSEFCLGMWMPLVDCDEDMGVLRFAAGSHRLGRVDDLTISDASEATYARLISERGLTVRSEPMRAGDATFHWGWSMHGAGPNRTERLREAMIVTFFADGTRVATPRHQAQDYDRVNFLGGRRPGERADGPLNPLLAPPI